MIRPSAIPIARSVRLIGRRLADRLRRPAAREVRPGQAVSGGPRPAIGPAWSRPGMRKTAEAVPAFGASSRGALARWPRRSRMRSSASRPGALPVARIGRTSRRSGASATIPPESAIAIARGAVIARNKAAAPCRERIVAGSTDRTVQSRGVVSAGQTPSRRRQLASNARSAAATTTSSSAGVQISSSSSSLPSAACSTSRPRWTVK